MKTIWLRSISPWLVLLLAAASADWMLGLSCWGVVALLLCWLAFEQLARYRFVNWLAEGGGHLPSGLWTSGLWGRAYRQALDLRLRSRKRKRRLSDYLRRSRQLATALPDAVIALDGANGIEWFNKAAGELFGLHPRDLGQRVDNLLRYPSFVRHLERGDLRQEVKVRLPGRFERVVALRKIPYGEGQCLLIGRDISHSARIEALHRDFVANASHELRTPLTVLAGYIEILHDRFADEPTMAQVIGQMQGQSERMRQLIDDLLTISRLEDPGVELECHRVSMHALIARLEHEAHYLSHGRHDIRVEERAECDLLGEEKTLYSAFSNLVGNALQYTPEGGRIEIRWLPEVDGARFEVVDSGCGIPATHLPRLTERFYRVDAGRSSELGGTGLGLSIVKHALRLHGARLEIGSSIGQGSRFSCHFPADRCIAAGPPTLEDDD